MYRMLYPLCIGSVLILLHVLKYTYTGKLSYYVQTFRLVTILAFQFVSKDTTGRLDAGGGYLLIPTLTQHHNSD